MRAIVNTAPNHLEMMEYPTSHPGPGQVRIRTGACGICATDLEMIAGWERTGFPAIPGHEWAGTVDAVGAGVDEVLIGHRCVAENVLDDGGEVGFEHPGGYAEYLVTDAARLQIPPDDFPLATATPIEPLAVAVRARRRLRPDAGDPALILGDGPIGLLMLQLLVREGDRHVVMVGGREPRLALAAELGVAQTLNYHHLGGDMAVAIRDETGVEFSTVVEASGSVTGMEAALELAGPCGRVLMVGDYGPWHASFRWNHVLHREIELIGSCASAGAWPEAVRLAVEERLPLERLVTHRVPVERFQEGVELTRSRQGDVVKVVMEWE